MEFDGKVAIVTGGGQGLGKAICRALGERGAMVIVADIDARLGACVAAGIAERGGAARSIGLDVTDPAQMDAAVRFAVESFGGLHLIVNNAGIAAAERLLGEYDVVDWHRVIDVNLNGVFYGLRYALPAIERSGGGAVVNMASVLGIVGIAGQAAYVAAKHAVIGLTRAAALDYARRGIRVNAVAPGYIDTPMVQAAPPDLQVHLRERHPVGRLGTAQEVAELVLFLLSERGAFITGSVHLVDGGLTTT